MDGPRSSNADVLQSYPVAGIPRRRRWLRVTLITLLVVAAAAGGVVSYSLFMRLRFLERSLGETYRRLEPTRNRADTAELRASDALAELERQRTALTSAREAFARERDALTAERNALQAQLAAAGGNAEQAEALARRLGALLARPEGEARAEAGRVVVRLDNDALFPPAQATLSPSGEAVLLRLAPVLREAADRQVWVESHTDAAPPPGRRFVTNWDLSAARAATVARFLQTRGELEPRRLAAAGLGEHRPAPDGDPIGSARTELILRP